MHRLALTALAVAALVVAPVAAVPAAAASSAPTVIVQLADPLMTDPVEVLVGVVDASGNALPFTGTVTLTTGRTGVTEPLASGDDLLDEVALPTTRLSGGWATVHAAVRAGGRAATATIRRFTEVPPGLVVGGFGCAALTPAGGSVRWAVTAMNGEQLRTPVSGGTYTLPYLTVPNGPTRIVDSNGLPLATHGRMVVRRGTKVVASVRLPSAQRALVFGVRWNARAGGRFVPGRYTATLTLTDANGRTVTASRPVLLVRSGTLPCV